MASMIATAADPAVDAKASLLPPVALDRDSGVPLQRQLYEQLREVILAGRLPPGARLPSTRSLRVELGCSRNTVVTAFEQLLSEGYLEGRVGAGTFVSSVLPEALLGVRGAAAGGRTAGKAAPPRLSRLAIRLGVPRRAAPETPRPFLPGTPDLEAFPFDVWGRLLGRSWRQPHEGLARHGPAAGLPRLRHAIAHYLRAVRAVSCEPEQVFITSGVQQAMDLAARALLDSGDRVWIEDPGYLGLRGPLAAVGAVPVPIPVDTEGLCLDEGLRIAPDARMAVITPSHQYPLGVTMTLGRRLALLGWARDAQAWILEDDYDSEFRYSGRPLAALQGLDDAERTLYVGTFSKIMFPSLRLGYLVVPPALAEPMACLRRALDDHPSMTAQPALAAFIEEGHFAIHVRRMRTLYAERRKALLDAADEHLQDLLEVAQDDAGLHLAARLAPELAEVMDDQAVSRRAATAGIHAPPLSSYYLGPPSSQGLLLGYAAYTPKDIHRAVSILAQVLRL